MGYGLLVIDMGYGLWGRVMFEDSKIKVQKELPCRAGNNT